MAKKKQNSNFTGWVILALLAFGIFQLATASHRERPVGSAQSPSQSGSTRPSETAAAPLTTPRFVNVESLNVRHSPGTSGELIMTLPRGTALRVLGRQD